MKFHTRYHYFTPAGVQSIAISMSACMSVCLLTYLNKKLRYRTATARRSMLVSSCDVSRGMAARKVSISKGDLQGHSRTLALVPFDRPHNFLLVFHYNCVFILHQDTIAYFPKFKEVTLILNTSPLAIINFACTSTHVHPSACKI